LHDFGEAVTGNRSPRDKDDLIAHSILSAQVQPDGTLCFRVRYLNYVNGIWVDKENAGANDVDYGQMVPQTQLDAPDLLEQFSKNVVIEQERLFWT
jgi:hypothetical protein